jgi:predicted trehalose synthase
MNPDVRLVGARNHGVYRGINDYRYMELSSWEVSSTGSVSYRERALWEADQRAVDGAAGAVLVRIHSLLRRGPTVMVEPEQLAIKD